VQSILRAYMMSYLLRQLTIHRSLDPRLPQHWLVWEPGFWNAPSQGEETVAAGQRPETPRDPRVSGDALCYGLFPSRLAEDQAVLIGRNPLSDLEINDATVSREHLRLTFRESQCQVEPLSLHRTTLRGRILSKGHQEILQDGDPIGLGEIQLTFYLAGGMKRRLEEETQKQLKSPTPR
jgi:hypothetical protein